MTVGCQSWLQTREEIQEVSPLREMYVGVLGAILTYQYDGTPGIPLLVAVEVHDLLHRDIEGVLPVRTVGQY